MIYGYYCVHPELIDECYEVAFKKQFIERLAALNAPEILLANELRLYEEQKSLQSDLSLFRSHIKELYSNNSVNGILVNYRAVFQDVGFDPLIAYSGNDSEYSSEIEDYLKPLENLPDEAVLNFISYTQTKFNEYAEKQKSRLNKIRSTFISRIKLFVENGKFPESALLNLTHLEQTTIELDDGFRTTLEGSNGYYKRYSNKIIISTEAFNDKGELILFYLFFHAIAGMSNSVNGFYRLSDFFSGEFKSAFDLINKTFANYQSISLLSHDPPEWLKCEQLRDSKVTAIIRYTGMLEISEEIFYNAYFSNNINDVQTLADAIKSQFNADELFSDLQSIKDTLSIDEAKFENADKFNHRFENIDAYFRHRYWNSQQILSKILAEFSRKGKRGRNKTKNELPLSSRQTKK